MNTSLIAHLETLPLEHLQTHLAAFPWFTASRVVLAKKNREASTLQSAAVYVQDRAWFKQYYESVLVENQVELIDETEISENVLEGELYVESIQAEPIDVVENLTAESVKVDEVETTFAQESSTLPVVEEVHPLQPKSFSDWLQHFSVSKDGKVTVTEQKNNASSEKDELEELIQSNIPYEMVGNQLDAETHYSKGLQTFINEQKTLKNAAVAVPLFDENTHLPITETFAKLLVAQQKYKQAISIYEKLSLKFPSKSTYFAALIKEAEKKI